MVDKERDFLKKTGIFLLGLVLGIGIDKAFIFVPNLVRTVEITSDSKKIAELVSQLPTEQMVTESEYGSWIGNQGICIDSCNGRSCNNEKLIINLNEKETTISGWAADFSNLEPFSNVYLQIGDQYIKCDYGVEKQSVVDNYQKESIRYVGIETTIPNSLFGDKVENVSFIGISQDAQYKYSPVEYAMEYIE